MRSRDPTVRCEDVREAVSARVDGEPSDRSDRVIDAHLATCRTCRDFQARSEDLRRRLALRVSRPAPEGLVRLLASSSAEPVRVTSAEPLRVTSAEPLRVTSGGPVRTLFSHEIGRNLRRVSRWAVALVPTIAVSIVLPFGISAHTRIVPTRQPTPCTAGLHRERSRG